jgi:hypothetical protein
MRAVRPTNASVMRKPIRFLQAVSCVRIIAFQGYELDHSTTYQPKKKPRGADLTPEDKTENTLISRIRILVEHVMWGLNGAVSCRRCPGIPKPNLTIW